MKSTIQLLSEDEISFEEIILKLWKERFLIIIITLTFSILGYIYGSIKPKVYQTNITIRKTPDFLLQKYEQFLGKESSHYFDTEFKFNLMQIGNLTSYVEQKLKIR